MTTTATWEKSAAKNDVLAGAKRLERLKFIIGGVLLLGVVAYLMISGTAAGARYFVSVDTLLSDSEYVGQTVRISGAVIGSTIEYDAQNLILDFTVAHIPDEFDDLAYELYLAVQDPTRASIPVHIEGEVMPDLLQNEAQAILTGTLGEDGIFYASELLLKCPSRYEEGVPSQAEA